MCLNNNGLVAEMQLCWVLEVQCRVYSKNHDRLPFDSGSFSIWSNMSSTTNYCLAPWFCPLLSFCIYKQTFSLMTIGIFNLITPGRPTILPPRCKSVALSCEDQSWEFSKEGYYKNYAISDVNYEGFASCVPFCHCFLIRRDRHKEAICSMLNQHH